MTTHADTGYGGDAEQEDGPKLWLASDLAPAAQPRWLAVNRLPRAAISLLIGDEGIGKSLLWVLVVAHITTGKPFPGFGIPAREPGNVIIVVTEDDWSTTVLPRLEVAGAELDMIRVICVEKDGSGSPIFPRDLPLIRNANPKPDLVVVDCWLDTVPAGLSVRDTQQARLALHPWKDLATTTGAAIWLLGHSNRISGGSIRDRYGATYVLRQKARMTIWAMADEDGALLAGPEKANGAAATVAVRFTITPIMKFEPTDEHDGTVPLLEYDQLSDMTIRDHVDAAAAAQTKPVREHSGDVTGWLAVQLADGPCWSVDLLDTVKQSGITERQFERAKRSLNVKSAREGGNGAWFMFLPQHKGAVPGVGAGSRSTPEGRVSRDCTSGTSGKIQKYTLSCEDARSTPQRYMERPQHADLKCRCGSQLTSPASIRYGSCQECRILAANI
jgi:hypothetical protein